MEINQKGKTETIYHATYQNLNKVQRRKQLSYLAQLLESVLTIKQKHLTHTKTVGYFY